MKLNLRKNKLMLVNIILFFVSFIVFLMFLDTINYRTSCDGDYSILGTFMDVIKSEPSYDLKERLYFGYIPVILIIINCGFFFIMPIMLIYKFNYYILMLVQLVYLVTVVWIYLVDLQFKLDYIIPYLSSAMLLPIIAFSVYNLICIAIFYIKDKRKPVDVETEVDTEKESII